MQSIEWNTICAIPTEGNQVLCLGWQDNSIVLFLSTVHTVHNVTDLIERERRRPNKTSTNAAMVRKAFGDAVRKNCRFLSS
jgi:uncharacterized protein YdeI (YjbR/CyaY-like superfamily)